MLAVAGHVCRHSNPSTWGSEAEIIWPLKKTMSCVLPATSGRSFSAPCASSPRTGKASVASSCLLATRKAFCFSFPRSIFAPALGWTRKYHMRKIPQRDVRTRSPSSKPVFKRVDQFGSIKLWSPLIILPNALIPMGRGRGRSVISTKHSSGKMTTDIITAISTGLHQYQGRAAPFNREPFTACSYLNFRELKLNKGLRHTSQVLDITVHG